MATKKPTPMANKWESTKKQKATADKLTQKVAKDFGINSSKPKPTPSPTLPTLAEFKQSAAYKTGAMTYKQYVDYFKSRGGM